MTDEQEFYQLRCDWEPCNKRLVDFCYVCAETNKYYCDSICSDRDKQDSRAKQTVTWQ